MSHLPNRSVRVALGRSVASLVLTLMVAACLGGGGDDSANVPTTPAGGSSSSSVGQSSQGKIIDNEDLSSGLKGVDANANGIRDDIDRLIAQKYARTPEIQRAAEQKARALQRNLEATTREEALRAGDAIMRAGSCADSVLLRDTPEQLRIWEEMSKDIEALTVNTEERFRAYWAANRLMSGAVFRQPNGEVCD